MTQDGYNGYDVLLLVNTGTEESPVFEAVAGQTNISVEENTAEIDVSSKTTGRAMRVIAGRYDSTMSLEQVYVPSGAAYQALRTAKRAGSLIKVVLQEGGILGSEGGVTEEATALITTMSRAYPDQDKITCSISLRINGEWAEVGS